MIFLSWIFTSNPNNIYKRIGLSETPKEANKTRVLNCHINKIIKCLQTDQKNKSIEIIIKKIIQN